ncbi:MAG TPA: maleylpyruvate isomerase N-terminal domain-containing protein [Candidatus Limnocylindria bacterium]
MPNDQLVDELHRERDAFFESLSRVTTASLTTPGLVGEWSARELIAHLGYWVGNAAEVIHLVEQGRADEVGAGKPPTDEVNETVARIARQTELTTVQKREAASTEALVERLRALDPALFESVLPDGATLAQSIREDGSEHYRDHAGALRRALDEAPRD